MGLFDRVESRLERAVNGAFAKAFKSEVEPVEIASAIRRAMDDRAAVVGHGRTLVPNRFSVELSDTDYDRLADMEDVLADELIASAQEHAESQRYSLGGPFEISFVPETDLETGVFRLRSSTTKRAGREPRVGADADADGRPPRANPAAQQAPPLPVEPFAQPSPRVTAQPPGRGYPAATDRPWLEIDGERYPLLGAITVLGRDDTADIVLDDPGVSRLHCELRVTSDGPHLISTIRDLQSTNGTFVEGNRITKEHLQDGNRLSVGRTSILYRARRR